MIGHIYYSELTGKIILIESVRYHFMAYSGSRSLGMAYSFETLERDILALEYYKVGEL